MAIEVKIICTVISHLNDKDSLMTEIIQNKYPWVASDPMTTEALSALVKRTEYKPSKTILDRVNRLLRMGFLSIIQRICCSKDVKVDVIPVTKLKTQDIRECVHNSRHLKIKEVGFLSVMYANIIMSGNVFLFALFVCFMALVYEYKPNQRKLRLRRHRNRIRRRRIRLIRIQRRNALTANELK